MLSKNKIKLINSLDKKKNRQEHGLFLIEGDKIVEESFTQNSFELVEVFATDDFQKNHPLLSRVAFAALKQASFLQHPQHAMALLKTKILTDQPTGNMLVLDDIQDPGNLGTMIRICDWFGIKNIVCSMNSVDVFNPKVVQASMGSVFRTNVYYKELNDFLPQLDIPIIATVLAGNNAYSYPWEGDCAIVIGNEGNGISTTILDLCTEKITIPNLGGAESLNASTAASILISEMNRQKMMTTKFN
jgi:RNA methyltransferase, TrmH family